LKVAASSNEDARRRMPVERVREAYALEGEETNCRNRRRQKRMGDAQMAHDACLR
jgi:hypothetical protein